MKKKSKSTAKNMPIKKVKMNPMPKKQKKDNVPKKKKSAPELMPY